MKFFFFFSFLLAGFSCMADETPKNLGTFGDWTAYTFNEGEEKGCYMATQPQKSSGKYSKRDDIFLMITHQPNKKTFNVVSTVAGYTYKTGSKPTITIDNKKAITLVPYEDGAWAKDSQTDNQLVEQMKAGSIGVLKGTSKRGTLTTDTFSLKGFSKAYEKINEACGRS